MNKIISSLIALLCANPSFAEEKCEVRFYISERDLRINDIRDSDPVRTAPRSVIAGENKHTIIPNDKYLAQWDCVRKLIR
jgi:hypothetical protein